MPAARTISIISSVEVSESFLCHGCMSGDRRSSPSFSMTMDLTFLPCALLCSVIFRIFPETLEWRAETVFDRSDYLTAVYDVAGLHCRLGGDSDVLGERY